MPRNFIRRRRRHCPSSAISTNSTAGLRTHTCTTSRRSTAPSCPSSSDSGESSSSPRQMKSHDVVFSSRPSLVSLQRLSYNGLDVAFSPYNDTWREMRKISTIHLFSAKQVESFLPIFKDEVSKMIEKIAIDAASSSITNLSETMMSFSSNTICRVAFGKSDGEEGYRKNRFFDLLRESHLFSEVSSWRITCLGFDSSTGFWNECEAGEEF